MKTPFVFGKTVSGDAFTDRENETAKLVSNFKYGVNTFIVSPRRWGKTSLVKKAKTLVENDDLKIVYVDVQQCRTTEEFCERYASTVLTQTSSKMEEWFENAKAFLSRISFGVNASADMSGEMSFKLQFKQKENSMEDMLQLSEKIAKKKNIRIVVCIDEFQQIGKFQDSLQFQILLRSIWQHHELASYCLFGSKKHMMESLFDNSSKPFYKFGDIIYLQRIPVEYWVKYIAGKFCEADKKITDSQAEWIVEKVDGNSSYVQQLSWYVFQRTENEVNDDILEDSLTELVDQCREVFDSKTDNLTSYQMGFLRAVADGVHTGFSSANVIETYKLNSSANVAIVKKALIDKDLIIEENKDIKLSDPVMGIWLQREY